MTVKKCEAEIELWGPHPGCKEFMTEPEAVVPCGQPATVEFDISEQVDEGEWSRDLVYLCDEHAQPVLDHGIPYGKINHIALVEIRKPVKNHLWLMRGADTTKGTEVTLTWYECQECHACLYVPSGEVYPIDTMPCTG